MLFWRKTFVQGHLVRDGSPRIEGGSSCGVSVWFEGHSSWRSLSPASYDQSHEMGHIIGRGACLHPPPSAHVDVMDMADTDSSDSGQPLRNRENDFEGVPQVRQSPFAVRPGSQRRTCQPGLE